jgi:ribosomal protein S18 acetylase RimI-like enzyme
VNALRRAVAADRDFVVRVTEAAYAPWAATLGAMPMPVGVDYAPLIARGEVWILADDGADAGLIVLEPEVDHLLIFSVAVDPAFQGRGHLRALLDHAEAVAREAGFAEVRLYTNALMERNRVLYARFGYAETGERDHPTRPGWRVVDMAKRLGAASA